MSDWDSRLLDSIKRRAVAPHKPLWWLTAEMANTAVSGSEDRCGFLVDVRVDAYTPLAAMPCHDPMPDTMWILAIANGFSFAATQHTEGESE